MAKAMDSFAAKFSAGAGRIVLAIGPYCWGKGRTAAEAIKIARRNLHGLVKRPAFVIYDAPEDVYVNAMGNICWKDGHQEIEEIGVVGSLLKL